MDPTDILFQIDQKLRQLGHPPMDTATLREAYKHLQNPTVLNMLQSGQLTAEQIAQQADQAIQVSKQNQPGAGLLPQGQLQGLPSGDRSRVFGAIQPSGAGEVINPFSLGAAPVTQPFADPRIGLPTGMGAIPTMPMRNPRRPIVSRPF